MRRPWSSERSPWLAGVFAVAPLLVGVVPFGLVFGAAAVDTGFSLLQTSASSVLVFAGASQVALVELLADDAAVPIAIATAWMINLRMLMYSASLAPYFTDLGLGRRLGLAYLLTDQAYAVSVIRYRDGLVGAARVTFYLGAAVALWVTWQVSTAIGALGGEAVPDEVPLEFAIPLVFLSLLIGVLHDRPAVVAAAVGGVASVLVAAAGLPEVAVMVGAVAGIAAGILTPAPERDARATPDEGETPGSGP